MKLTPKRLLACALVAGFSLVARAADSPEDPLPAVQLSTKLISPTNIELDWKDANKNVDGYVVEWATEAKGDFVIVAFLAPRLRSFVHADLMPETNCFYRVRPYFGPLSNEVEITTGKALPDGVAPNVADETWAEPKTTPEGTAKEKQSIRDPAHAAAGAPTELKAKLLHPTGILLTWVNHASDEEGQMLEKKEPGDTEYHVCALIDPKVNSFGYALVPPETKVSFRLRPYYYGRVSNVDNKTTKSESSSAP